MKIKLLDENTIKKIAAGEVIENPANIVKELIENSIDANAKNITIDIINGGISSIKITDDGDGFDYDDMIIAFKQHATSKLNDINDIYDINSYGFRGEALSSIASVSKTSLITKNKNSDELFGYKYIVNNENSKLEKTASNYGTTLVIEDLFYNIPVRKNFLKTSSRESAEIEDIVMKFALIHPEIKFKFITDGNEKFSTNGDSNLKNVIFTIYGKNIYENLIEVNEINDNIKIFGYISNPIVLRNNRNDMIYFINDRYVKSNIIRKSIEDAYSEYLLKSKFPLVILKIYVKNNSVDINVHPKKMEVRFDNDWLIYENINNIITNALKNSNLIHEEKLINENIDKNINKNNEINDTNEKNIINKEAISFKNLTSLKNILTHKSNSSIDIINVVNKIKNFNSSEKIEEKPFINKTLTDDHKYIGQIFNTYILIEFEEKLYIIDQHAAHEKINYEKIINSIKENKIVSQKIFPSIILNLTPIQYNAVINSIESFKKVGYEIYDFGDNKVKVDAVPFNLLSISSQNLLLEMIDEFVIENTNKKYNSLEEKIASMSCKKAIKANHKLNENEVKYLLKELFKLDNPYNCPHGRPTIISLSKYEFEKKFGRVVV